MAYAIAERSDRAKRWEGLAIAAAAFLPPVFLSWAFPEGGWAPFPTSAYVPIPLFALACLLILPREQSALRWGAVLYAAGSTLALAHRDAHGRQRRPARRPLRRPRPPVRDLGPAVDAQALGDPGPGRACSFQLVLWQWSPAVRDVKKYIEDPAAKADYFQPLRDFLFRLPDQRRIEIPFTRSHWEGAEIAMDQPLARGWLRQLDTRLNPIFYKGNLTPLTYASWLSDNAVRYVALASAKPDKSSYGERALIEKGLPYLRLRWKSDDWRVYEVLLPSPLLVPQGDARMSLDQFQSDELLIDVKKPGRGDRQGALDALLVRHPRVRRAVRRLDEGDRQGRGLRAHVHPLRARTALLARPSLRRRLSYARRPCPRPTRSWSSWLGSGA